MSLAVIKQKCNIKYKVRFDLNGGTSISESEKTYNLGDKYTSFPTATKDGMICIGFYTDPISGTKITTNDEVDFRINILYPHFIAMTNFTSYEVTTTSSYKKFGIYSATLKSGSSSVMIDWGDGTIEEVTENISQKTHEYATVGTFIVKISDDIQNISISSNNSTWYSTTSQVRYTLKKILHYSTSITSIPQYGYYYCYNLTSVSGIGDSNIMSLPSYCFHYCYNLSSLNGLSKITSIGTYCFSHCYYLTSFTGIGNITSLTDCSFYGCYCITSLNTLPTTVTSYSQYCLYNTRISDLSRIRTTDTLGSWCFSGMNSLTSIATLTPRSSLPSYCFLECNGMKSVDFSNWTSLTAIPSYCFYANYNINNINIGSYVKNIATRAFYSCYNSLVNLNLKDTNLTSIEQFAFNYCYNLTSTSLPSTLQYIYDYAFAGCYNLYQMSCYTENAPITYANTFGNVDSNSTYSYVGRNKKTTGNNILYVNNPDAYTSYWQSVLLDSSKCGFNVLPFDEYDARGFKVEGLSAKYEYTGQPITPSVTVKNTNGTALTENTDYTKEYANNTECGTASLTITGINSYHNALTKTFKIYDPSQMTIEVDLNGQWRVATTKTNPDPTNYDLYESNSNYNVGNAFAKMYVRLTGYTDLNLYIGSYAEKSFDYTVIFNQDVECTSNPSTGTSGAKGNTRGFQKSGNNIDTDFKKISYTLDGGEHFITICYRKDGSVNSGYDRGYLLVPKTHNYLYFKGSTDNDTISLIGINAATSQTIPVFGHFQYSTDNCQTWNAYDGHSVKLSACTNCKMYMRADPDNPNTNGTADFASYKYQQFITSGNIIVGGNIQYLFTADGSRTDVPDYGFLYLFQDTTIITTPSLPATVVGNGGYSYMFKNCRNLHKASDLSVQTFTGPYGCCEMFYQCKKLVKAPKIPATTLAANCYDGMFGMCHSLSIAPELPATTLADNCYYYMFTNCTSLKQAPLLPATTLARGCYIYMFEYCPGFNDCHMKASMQGVYNTSTHGNTLKTVVYDL